MASWNYGERHLPTWANVAIIVVGFVILAVIGVWQS